MQQLQCAPLGKLLLACDGNLHDRLQSTTIIMEGTAREYPSQAVCWTQPYPGEGSFPFHRDFHRKEPWGNCLIGIRVPQGLLDAGFSTGKPDQNMMVGALGDGQYLGVSGFTTVTDLSVW